MNTNFRIVFAAMALIVLFPSQANAGFIMGYAVGSSSGHRRTSDDDDNEKLVKCYERELQDRAWKGKDPKEIIHYCRAEGSK